MIVRVRVVPKASRIKVEEQADASLKVRLSRPACDGEANAQLIEVLADYWKVKKYQVNIVKGLTSRDKLIEVEYAQSPKR